MSASRREFLGQLTTGAAMFGAMPLSADLIARRFAVGPASETAAEEWDLSWVKKLTGKNKAVFDVPEIESGYGVWRATIWVNQYQDVLKIPAKELNPVLVLRHNGIVLAMQQSFWDKYNIGKEKKVMHPVTQQATDRNPALLSSKRNEQPAMFDPMALDQFIAHGGIALACNLALQEMVDLVKEKEKVSEEEARKQAIAALVPGVIVQPSGVFAALRAQEVGCLYLRAS
jgi:hypothetical protein